MAEGDYEDGLKTGVWAFYFGNGSLRSQGLYENDVKLGKWKDWDRSGLMTETEFHEGLKKKV
jgi:antitoxin component YwqK of YwqJK toxin-antitoxin module